MVERQNELIHACMVTVSVRLESECVVIGHPALVDIPVEIALLSKGFVTVWEGAYKSLSIAHLMQVQLSTF